MLARRQFISIESALLCNTMSKTTKIVQSYIIEFDDIHIKELFTIINHLYSDKKTIIDIIL